MKAILNIAVIACLVLLSSSCNKCSEEPQCIVDEVKAFNKNADCPTGNKVKKYKFQGEFVYVFEEGICIADGAHRVLNAGCQPIGWLGGIIGNRTINGGDFDEAVLIKTLMY